MIWVAVGGRDSLVAVALSTYALNWLNYSLSSAGNQYALVIIGVLLVIVMMFFPRGIIVRLRATCRAMAGGRRWRPPGRGVDVETRRGPRHGGAGQAFRWRGRDRSNLLERGRRRAALHHRPNGAGKSTLFSLLCGIYRPDTGQIILKGQDVTALPSFRRVRLGLGLTFQTNRAYHDLSVRQNLEAATRSGAVGDVAADERYRYARRAVRP